MVEKNMAVGELLDKAWSEGYNGFLIFLDVNKIVAVESGESVVIPENLLFNIVNDKLCSKGIDSCGKDFRVAYLGTAILIGRDKTFDRFLKKNKLDKVVKPLWDLMKEGYIKL